MLSQLTGKAWTMAGVKECRVGPEKRRSGLRRTHGPVAMVTWGMKGFERSHGHFGLF